MLVCRCCLTFEDNLYPFSEYKSAFKECTGLGVESTAMICPTCIRKLGEAHAFREQSLKSDEFLQAQRASGIIVKSEPADADDDDMVDDEPSFDDNDFEPIVKVEEKPVVDKYDNDSDGLDEQPFFSEIFLKEEPPRKRAKRGQKKRPKLETPQALANSMRAKLAWSHGTKENLIKECPYCFLSGLKKSDLKRHIQEHATENGGYECDHCNKKFMKKRVLKAHIHRVYLGIVYTPSHKPEYKKSWPCSECKETFPLRRLLRNHCKEQHPHLADENPGQYTCSECGKMFRTKQNLEQHEMDHSGLRPFICPTCGRSYKSKVSLKSHELSHTGERPFLCTICGRGYKTKSELKSHEPIHTGDLRFPCDICGKRFAARNLLNMHLISHDEVPKHGCDICGQKFRYSFNLTAHKLSHTERRDFSCNHCGTNFKQRFSLQRHMKQHAAQLGLDDKCVQLRKLQGSKVEGFLLPNFKNEMQH